MHKKPSRTIKTLPHNQNPPLFYTPTYRYIFHPETSNVITITEVRQNLHRQQSLSVMVKLEHNLLPADQNMISYAWWHGMHCVHM